MVVALLLSGCAATNEFLETGGKEGNRDTLPVKLETLIEMAEYCNEVYEDGEELEDDQFSYNLIRSEGITILIFRGTANAKNILTDIGEIGLDWFISLSVWLIFLLLL